MSLSLVRSQPYTLDLVEASPLRRADPRAKLALCLGASLAVMLPLERLAIFMGLYLLLLVWARLLPVAAKQVWRLKWLLLALFIVDWVAVSLDLAVIVTLRVLLLAGIFSLVVSTTTPGEFRLALERLRVPYRYAFSISLAFQSINLLAEEWRAIYEAQRSRGALPGRARRLAKLPRLRDWVALTVPAIVLTTRRAWAITEAACARGFDSPHRRPYRQLAMGWPDWGLVAGIAATIALLVFL
jgi:energy-coupling factor transporter transmembrane protein EcfT